MDFELTFTDKKITPWDGMALMKRILEHLKFEEALKPIQLSPKMSLFRQAALRSTVEKIQPKQMQHTLY